MSEEVKDGQETAEGGAQAGKKKKMNRLSAADVNRKIAELEEKKMTLSRYYIHLQYRKREIEAAKK